MISVNFSITDLLAVMDFAGKNDTRFYLNGVRLHVGADFNNGRMAGRIDATNGHVLVACALDSEDITVMDEESRLRELILDINSLKRFVKKPRAKDRDDCQFIITGQNVHYIDQNDPSVLFPIDVIDGRYPDTLRVLKSAFISESVADNFSPVSADYLSVISKATKLFMANTNTHGDGIAPIIHAKDSGHNLIQLSGRPDVVMIAMGCRVNQSELHKDIPYWLERDLMDETDHSDTGT